LEKYAGNALRVRSSSPKFQVFNTGLLTAQSNERFEAATLNPEPWGAWWSRRLAHT
jgi:hypothetical protein